jgi:hypothetical protein
MSLLREIRIKLVLQEFFFNLFMFLNSLLFSFLLQFFIFNFLSVEKTHISVFYLFHKIKQDLRLIRTMAIRRNEWNKESIRELPLMMHLNNQIK